MSLMSHVPSSFREEWDSPTKCWLLLWWHLRFGLENHLWLENPQMRVDVPIFLKRRAKLSSSNSELRLETFLELPMKLLKHSASWDIIPRSTSPNPTNSTWKPQYSVYPFQFQVEAWKKHFFDLKVIQFNLPFWLTFSDLSQHHSNRKGHKE